MAISFQHESDLAFLLSFASSLLKRLLTSLGIAKHDEFGDGLHILLKEIGVEHVDLLILDMVHTCRSVEPTKITITDMIKTFLKKRANQLLVKSPTPLSKQTLNERASSELFHLAKIVFLEEVANVDQVVDYEDRASAIGWGLFVGHPRIRRFLIAYYICNSLHHAFDNDSALIEEKWQAAGLSGKVFPAEINKHCKHLMNSDEFPQMCDSIEKIVRRRLEEAAETIELYQLNAASLDEALRILAPHVDIVHLVYLLGRISVADKTPQAVGLLYLLNSEYVIRIGGLTKGSDISVAKELQSTLLKLNMLQCTIIISRVYADEENSHSATEDYIRFLLRRDWCDMAKGFHLEYHEDENFQYDFSRPERAEKDSLHPFPRCINAMLETDLSNTDGNGNNGIHIATLCAITLGRIGDERAFSLPGQSECLRRMDAALTTVGELTGALNALVSFTRRALRVKTHIHPSSITFLLMKMDQRERSGQVVDLKSLNCRTESVAEHTCNAMILAERILPEQLPHPPGDYDKGEVLRMILAHDFPECVTGDWRYDECTEQVKKTWFNVAESLQWSVLLGAGDFGFFDRWVAVERSYENSLNSTCAWFCDKLQLLMELFRIKNMDDSIDVAVWVVFVQEVLAEIRRVNSNHPFITRMVARTVSWFGLTKEELLSDSNRVINAINNGSNLFSEIEVYDPHKVRDV